MADSYTFPKPTGSQDASIFQFLEQFYRISDTPDAHDVYAEQFAKDATLVMGSKKSYGAAGMLMQSLLLIKLTRQRLIR
jgi:hypothetical protein